MALTKPTDKILNVTAPTVQRFTSGSGTYTTPTGCKYIIVEMVGGGGGGGGSGSTLPGGGNGGNTTFGSSLLTANGGSGCPASTGWEAPGGSATVNSPAVAIIAVAGGQGNGARTNPSTGGAGSVGGSSYLGGAGASRYNTDGQAAAANSGSGGGGGGQVSPNISAGGGGAGAYIKALITSPSSTYSYAVGAAGTAGTAGTGGNAGGAGGSGLIVVTEYYV